MSDKSFIGSDFAPGITDRQYNQENQVTTYVKGMEFLTQHRIAAASLDSGNTANTSILRAGLIMGPSAADSKLLLPYNPAQSDLTLASHKPAFVVERDIDMRDNGFTTRQNKLKSVYGGAVFDPSRLIVTPASTPGIVGRVEEFAIRKAMVASGRFLFTDNALEPPIGSWVGETAETAAANILLADRDMLFTNAGATGAVTLTIPATLDPYDKLAFYFRRAAAYNLVISAADANISGPGDFSATTATLAADGDLIALVGDGSSWVVHTLAGGNPTLA